MNLKKLQKKKYSKNLIKKNDLILKYYYLNNKI